MTDEKDGEEGNSQNHVDRVTAIKVPPFYPEDPSLWFLQLEGQFQLNNITSDNTKYFHVLTNLEPRYTSLSHKIRLDEIISCF